MHWLPRSVGRKRVGKFKHAGIFSHDPVHNNNPLFDQQPLVQFFRVTKYSLNFFWREPVAVVNLIQLEESMAAWGQKGHAKLSKFGGSAPPQSHFGEQSRNRQITLPWVGSGKLGQRQDEWRNCTA